MSDGGTLPPADWYPDPTDPSRMRFWDGQGWTAQTQVLPPPVERATAEPVAPKPPAQPPAEVEQSSGSRPFVWLLGIALLVAAVPVSLYVLDWYEDRQACSDWETAFVASQARTDRVIRENAQKREAYVTDLETWQEENRNRLLLELTGVGGVAGPVRAEPQPPDYESAFTDLPLRPDGCNT